jgi:hypothetical protein
VLNRAVLAALPAIFLEKLHEEEQMDHAAPDSQGTWAQACPLVAGVSSADARRFAEAASGFMGALLEDPRVTTLQAAWRADMESFWLRIAKSLGRGTGSGKVAAPPPRSIRQCGSSCRSFASPGRGWRSR